MEGKYKLKILDDCELLMRYVLTAIKNKSEWKYTINQQILRSCLSVGSNIAEGSQRNGNDSVRFMDIALGSLEECRFQLRFYKVNKIETNRLIEKIRAITITLRIRARDRVRPS